MFHYPAFFSGFPNLEKNQIALSHYFLIETKGQFQRSLCQSVAMTIWNTVGWVLCFIKTFQIIWKVWNASENLMEFPIFQDFLPFNSK